MKRNMTVGFWLRKTLQCDCATFRELNGVALQVEDNLLQAEGVSADEAVVVFEPMEFREFRPGTRGILW